MKRSFILTAAIVALAFASSTAFSKEKSTDAKTTSGKKFDMTGTVKKNAVGICPMEGAKWDLLSNVGQPAHLAAANDQVAKELDKVAGTRKRVRVEGAQVPGVECPHVKVVKVSQTK